MNLWVHRCVSCYFQYFVNDSDIINDLLMLVIRVGSADVFLFIEEKIMSSTHDLHFIADASERHVKNGGLEPEPYHAANVIRWPGGQADRPALSVEDCEGASSETFSDGRDHASAIASMRLSVFRDDDITSLLPHNRVRPGVSLREEARPAMRAYKSALDQLRATLPGIVAKNTVEVRRFEGCVADLVASLERNRDALLCLSKNMRGVPYLYSHSLNVGVYLAAFFLECGKSRYEAITAGIAGLLHDVGMAMLPFSLLNSKKRLTATERVLVKRHPQLACDLLSRDAQVDGDIFFAALEHHEFFDGTGYPSGLSGAAISFMGHLTSIASAYDAVSSFRPFHDPLHPHRALCRLFKRRSTQFHPALLEHFVSMVGVFPVGSVVELQDGYRAIVCSGNSQSPTRPGVLLVSDPDGRNMAPLACDMAAEPVAGIVKCLEPEDIGLDAGAVFKILMEYGA